MGFDSWLRRRPWVRVCPLLPDSLCLFANVLAFRAALGVDEAVLRARRLLGALSVEEYGLRQQTMTGSRLHRGCLLAGSSLPDYGVPSGWTFWPVGSVKRAPPAGVQKASSKRPKTSDSNVGFRGGSSGGRGTRGSGARGHGHRARSSPMTLSPLSGFSDESDADASGKEGPAGDMASGGVPDPKVAAVPGATAAPGVPKVPARVAIANPLGSDSEDYGPSSEAEDQLCSSQSVPSTPGALRVSILLFLSSTVSLTARLILQGRTLCSPLTLCAPRRGLPLPHVRIRRPLVA